MQTFRIYTEELWRAVLEAATTEPLRAAALESAGVLVRYMNGAAAEAGAVYVEAERLLHAEGVRVRRDLLEDLIAGRSPAPGPKLAAARLVGLLSDTPLVVAVASSLPSPEVDQLRSVAIAISRETGSAVPPLTVVRHDEVVLAVALRERVETLIDGLRVAHRSLAQEGITAAIGVSTVHHGAEQTAEAYEEAAMALERTRTTGGILALPALSVFNCLTIFGAQTARQRISTDVRRFVRDDRADGAVLTNTLLAYVAADLNAKLAATRLFVHPNTVRYRLARIEERTNCDLHRVTEVLDLVVAIHVETGSPADLDALTALAGN